VKDADTISCDDLFTDISLLGTNPVCTWFEGIRVTCVDCPFSNGFATAYENVDNKEEIKIEGATEYNIEFH